MESLEDFRIRACAWIQRNLETRGETLSDDALRERDAVLQARIYDAGFAGLAVPRDYGGQGLTLDHQKVFAEEAAGFETPRSFMVSIGMMLPTLLEDFHFREKITHFDHERIPERVVHARGAGAHGLFIGYGNAARWINHACDPNCRADEQGRQVFIEALREIEPGEELFYDYGLIIDERLTPKLKKEYECRCGSPNCRRTMLAPKKR